MTNVQLLLSIGIPTFFVLVGILLNHREVAELRSTMVSMFAAHDRQFDRIEARLTRIEDDQKHFFEVTGKLDGRIDQLSRG